MKSTVGESLNNMANLVFILTFTILISGCSKEIESLFSKSINQSDTLETPPVVPEEPEEILFEAGVDPLAEYAWHLNNTGQRSFAIKPGTAGEDINYSQAQSLGVTGNGIAVAISDNGTEIFHPDLVSNSWFGQHRNYNYSNSDYWNSDPTPDGDEVTDAHGTAVAGIIASTFNNSIGSFGIASNVKFGAFHYVGVPYDLVKTLDQTNGPFDIFNYSYGRPTCFFQDLPEALILQLDYGVTNLRAGKGALYVKAAGNEYISSLGSCVSGESGLYMGNTNLEEDNSFPFIILVGATTAFGESASYSTPGSSLWLSAPGGNYGITYPAIITTDLSGCEKGYANTTNGINNFDKGRFPNEDCNYTATMNGTSSSAPMVSGAIALILETRNDLSWRDVKQILALSARQIDENLQDITQHPFTDRNLSNAIFEYGWQTNSAGYRFHNWYGFGSLDVGKAVEIAQNYTKISSQIESTNWRNESPILGTSIPDNSFEGIESKISVNDNYVIEALQVRISIEHPYASELGIILESPSGMKSTLLYYNSGMLQEGLNDEIMLSNAFFFAGPRFPNLSKKIESPLKIFAMILMMALAGIAFAKNTKQFLEYFDLFFWLVVAHNAIAITIGYLGAMAAKLPIADRRAIALEVGIQNGALALVIIFTFFPQASGMLLIAAFWGVWHLVSGLVLSFIWSRMPIKDGSAQLSEVNTAKI